MIGKFDVMLTDDSGIEGKGRVWASRPFRWLFSAFTVSALGSEVTSLVLPLVAALTLNAGPVEMGALAATGSAPTFLLSLFAGMIVDRLRRQLRLMIAADLARGVLLLSLPAALAAGLLSMPLLYAVTFLLGTAVIFHETAQNTYLLQVLPRRLILDANCKLQVSYSLGEAAGPGLGGVLVQAVTAPLAILVAAVAPLASAVLLTRARTPVGDAAPRDDIPARTRLRPIAEIMDGVRALVTHPVLGSWTVWGAGSVVFLGAFEGQYLLFATRSLHLDPGAIGLVALFGAAGALPATFAIRPMSSRLPTGKSIVAGLGVSYLALLAIPLAPPAAGHPAALVAILVAARVVQTFTFTISNVQQWSLRQMSTPHALLGRVSAANRFLMGTAETLGALLGGLVSHAIGLQITLGVFAVAGALTLLPLLGRPIWKLDRLPDDGSWN